MNRATMKKDRENQKLLLQELERLSDDTIISDHQSLFAQPIHDPSFSAIPLFFSSEVGIPRDHCNQTNHLLVDVDNHTETPLEYHPLSAAQVSDNQHLQVDHNGTKVLQMPLSVSWLSSGDAPDVGTCTSSTTSSVSEEKSPFPSPACVAAAATAAMIVVPDEHIEKRPRSPLHHDLSGGEASNEDDCKTETSLQDTEGPTSPRSVSGFQRLAIPKNVAPVDKECPLLPSQQHVPVKQPTQPMKTIQSLPTRRLTTDVQKGIIITLSLNSSRDPAACRKRRAEAMERFRRKKAVRSFSRKVRYQIRKRIATTRPRVNGRFARRCDADTQTAKTNGNK